MAKAKTEHRVYGARPGSTQREFVAAFTLERWQFAEKLVQYLLDRGFTEVERIEALETDEE